MCDYKTFHLHYFPCHSDLGFPRSSNKLNSKKVAGMWYFMNSLELQDQGHGMHCNNETPLSHGLYLKSWGGRHMLQLCKQMQQNQPASPNNCPFSCSARQVSTCDISFICPHMLAVLFPLGVPQGWQVQGSGAMCCFIDKELVQTWNLSSGVEE